MDNLFTGAGRHTECFPVLKALHLRDMRFVGSGIFAAKRPARQAEKEKRQISNLTVIKNKVIFCYYYIGTSL
jgi:hypothetical protein